MGSFDDASPYYRWTLIGQFVAEATSATVTVTNTLSSGVLYTNGIRCVLVPTSFIGSGDTLVVNMGDSALTTSAGTTASKTLTATLATDAEWFPFDPSLPRAITGYNSGGMRPYNSGHPLANRAKLGAWNLPTGAAVDSNGELTSSSTDGQQVSLAAIAGGQNGIVNGNGEDYWGVPSDKAGTWLVRFTVPHLDPVSATTTNGVDTITVSSASGLLIGMSIYGTGITNGTFVTGISGTTITMSQNATATGSPSLIFGGNPQVAFGVGYPYTVDSTGTFGPGGTSGYGGNYGGAVIEFPITVTLDQPTNPVYSPQINLNLNPNNYSAYGGSSTGNASIDIIQNLWIGSPYTTSGTPSSQVTDPVRLARVQNNFPGGFLRHMNDLNVVNNTLVNWEDQHPQTGLYGSYSVSDTVGIASVLPVTNDTTYSSWGPTAYALAGAAWSSYNQACVLITTKTPHGRTSGQALNLFGDGGGFFNFTDSSWADNAQAVVISVTNGGSGYTSPPTVTLTGGTYVSPSTATAVLYQGSVSKCVVSGGSTYTAPPTVSFSGGGGTGAAATASISALNLYSGGNAFPATVVLVLDSTTLLMNCNSTLSGQGQPTTLLAPISMNGTEYFVYHDGQYAIPAGDCILSDVECGINSWIAVPCLSSDEFCNKLGQYHAANTSAGHLIIPEFGNEIWNTAIVQWLLKAVASQVTYEWTSTGGASAPTCPSGRTSTRRLTGPCGKARSTPRSPPA